MTKKFPEDIRQLAREFGLRVLNVRSISAQAPVPQVQPGGIILGFDSNPKVDQARKLGIHLVEYFQRGGIGVTGRIEKLTSGRKIVELPTNGKTKNRTLRKDRNIHGVYIVIEPERPSHSRSLELRAQTAITKMTAQQGERHLMVS